MQRLKQNRLWEMVAVGDNLKIDPTTKNGHLDQTAPDVVEMVWNRL
jgi:hypothetical protein